jgi:hypothetical protein
MVGKLVAAVLVGCLLWASDPLVRVEVHVDPDVAATWQALAALGFKGEGRMYTMPSRGSMVHVKGCIVTEWGVMPERNVAKARLIEGLDVMHVQPVSPAPSP